MVRPDPMIYFVASGSKWLSVRGRQIQQKPGSLFVTSVELPIGYGYADGPFRAMALSLDPHAIAALVAGMAPVDMPMLEPAHVSTEAGPAVLEAMHRMLRLLDEPAAIGVLAPMIEREILYRLLSGPAAAVIRRVGRGDARLRKIRLVADWVRKNPSAATTITELAAMASVSESTLHRHFREVTGRTPMQFQKDLRLQEARQRLLAGREPPKAVAAAVGYLSVSQFSREYRRHFGATPHRDLEQGRVAVETA